MDLKGRDFLTLKDFTAEEIIYLVDLAAELKEKKKKGIPVDTLRGKNVALIFEKTSTRTRCAFEVAAHDLGMGTTYLDPSGSQIGKKESIRDTARVLGRMFEGIEYRGFGQEIVEELAKYAGVPVWNGLTNEYHPTQMLADMLTIREHLGHLKGVKLVYMGDARYNMGNSLMIACAKLGMHFVACAPEKYFPNALRRFRRTSRSHSRILLHESRISACIPAFLAISRDCTLAQTWSILHPVAPRIIIRSQPSVMASRIAISVSDASLTGLYSRIGIFVSSR